MKKLFTLFLALAASVGTMSAAKIGGLYYNLNKTTKTAEVTYEKDKDTTNYAGLTVANISSSVKYDAAVTCSVTSIGEKAFYWCHSLTSVTIPNSVTRIKYYAFYYCKNLTGKLIIPNSVISIGHTAFSQCFGLTSVTIGNSVESIEDYVFYKCTGLTGELIIPNSVTSIGEDVFNGCSGLTSIIMGNSVTSIGSYAFSGCSGLKEVHINDLASWCKIAFSRADSNPLVYAKHLYFNDNEITELIIPDGVNSVGNYAFQRCVGLTSITIPNSVTKVGKEAFKNCSGLTSITSEAVTPPSCGSDAFKNVDKSIPLYVPAGSVDAYKAANQWKEFNIVAQGQTIDNADATNKPVKVLNDGKVYILRGDKTFDLRGQEVK